MTPIAPRILALPRRAHTASLIHARSRGMHVDTPAILSLNYLAASGSQHEKAFAIESC